MRIGDRIKIAREAMQPKMTQADLAKLIDQDQSTVGHWERGRGHPKGNMAEKVAMALGVEPEWLSYGKGHGPELRSDFDPKRKQFMAPVESPDLPVRNIRPENVDVPEIDPDAVAGHGSADVEIWGDGRESSAQTGVYSFPAAGFRELYGSPPGAVRIIPVKGDSMEPTLRPGQRVMIDITDRRPSPSGLFVLWDGLGMVIKRLEFIPHSSPPTVKIISDNPRHGPYDRLLEEAYIQGRVIGSWERR